jgi:opacity protein-like surface antigen
MRFAGRRGLALITFATVCVAPPRASASSGEWVIAGFLGAAHTLSAPVTIEQPAPGTELTLSPVEFHGESFEPPVYYGYRVGYLFDNRWFGLEAEFIHSKLYAHVDRRVQVTGVYRNVPTATTQPMSDVVQHLSISHGLNFLLLNGVVRVPLGETATSRVAVLLRGGAGPTIPHAESRIDGVAQEQYEWGRLGVQASAGAEVRLTRRLGALAEYKFTRSRQRVSVWQGEMEVLARSHHVVFGVVWHS